MKRLTTYLICLGLFLIVAGCEDNKPAPAPGQSVDFFALEHYETDGNSCRIIDSTVSLSDSIIIPYADIISYDPDAHAFTINADVAEWLQGSENHTVHRTTFAVAVDGEVIYTGYFWAAYSSAICNWVTIDPLMISGDPTLKVKLGYPWDFDDVPDRRNDDRLLRTLRQDGKLVE